MLTLAVLFITGALGVLNGIREVGGDLTPFQRSISVGGLAYGVVGLAAAAALLARHRWSVRLAAAWAVIVTYVGGCAALAYAPDATVAGAIAAGIASALIGAAVVWGARAALRSGRTAKGAPRARGMVSVILLAACIPQIGACRQLYSGPPTAGRSVAGDMDGLRTKRVRAKREPDLLIAEDLTECSVVPEVFRGVKPGDHWRCAWRPVP